MAPKTEVDSSRDLPSPSPPSPAILNRLRDPATDLIQLLHDFGGQTNPNVRVLFFVRLIQWMRSGSLSSSTYGSLHRLEELLSLLEGDAPQRASFQRAFHAMLGGTQSISLFAEAGLHPRESLWSEVLRRVVERVLPSAREEGDLSKLVYNMYTDQRYIQSFLKMPDELFKRMVLVLTPPDDPLVWKPQKEFLGQALCLLGAHVAGISLSPEFRERCHSFPVAQSPFYRLQRITGDLVNGIEPAAASASVSNLQAEMMRCRAELEYMHERMEFLGVSTALEFNISTVERAIKRIERIIAVLFHPSPQNFNSVKKMLDDVMSARREDLSLSAVVRENTGLLARKIVERTGRTGEHYIANTRSEYWKMWKAALGGGLLVVATAAIKMKVTTAHLPPFIEGFLVGTNFAISFLILQTLGLALATKQPSMTAATYAKIVRETEGEERLEKLTVFISRITRTQLAAAAGNLLTVTLGAILFAKVWSRLFSEPYLLPTSSRYVYETLHPLASGTAAYAALTGLVLWVSALVGGWVENFAAYNRVPEAIADHPLGWRLGFDRMRRYADLFERNISGWSTSIVLGYLLGFIPVVGDMFGIPLDVRHVTLSTGTLALAAASLGRDWLYRGWFLYTLFGIAIIFVLNLGVSFGIASWVALRAYGVPRADQMQLLGYVAKSFCKSPLRFLYPRAKG